MKPYSIQQTETLLKLEHISVSYGGVQALKDLSLSLDEGEVVALMGPNGAGKSTVLKSIFGLVPHEGGAIYWHQKLIKPIPHEVVYQGISFVPQGRRVFRNLSVYENLEIGGSVIGSKREIARRIAEVMDTFPDLAKKSRTQSGTLSGGQQQMLALARGLMVNPSILLLDEPSLGLSPKLVQEVFGKIKEINECHKTAILIVEHNLKSLLSIVSRGYVLDKGACVASGTAGELVESGILERVFLGKA
jgi:branched-chain amino acid transport system ATP-binding protein